MQSLWKNIFFRRFLVICFSAISVLGTAFSCSLPTGFGIGQTQATTLGLLKRDSEIREEGFVRANSVVNVDGQNDSQGLSKISISKIYRFDKENLFILTKEKGIFKTEDSAFNWKRIYIVPVDSKNSDNNAKTKENASKIAQNDKLIINDFAVDPADKQNIFLALSENNVGKIYQSKDGGSSFKEIYKEVSQNIGVSLIAIDPVDTQKVYAVLEKGALIKSLDGGQTWQKIRSFKDTPIQIGFVPEFGQAFFLLFATDGLAFSNNSGETWELQKLSKDKSEIGENQPKDNFDISFTQASIFGKYEKIIPVTTGFSFDYDSKRVTKSQNSKSWILIADRQIWVSGNNGQNFKKLVLPAQREQLNIYDVNYNPQVGLSELYVSINNKLFTTQNQGSSWNTQDQINLSGELGNISQILVDSDNPSIVYLALADKKYSRQNGFLSF